MSYDNIFKTRNDSIHKKKSVFDLIMSSYEGGQKYLKENHLFRFYRENINEFYSRHERSVYLNFLKPVVEVLSGLIYFSEPKRKYPDLLKPFIEKAYKEKSFDSFMQMVINYSCLVPVGVLVDTENFSPDEIATEADYIESGIKPYCILYKYNRIRDYYFSPDGCLEWVLLDNSYIDKSDPFSEPIEIKKYTLWNKEKVQDFLEIEGKCQLIGEKIHNLGFVPFTFVSWNDSEDIFSTSFSEEIALTARSIYNKISEWGESISASTFQNLFYPVGSGEDIPEDLRTGGYANLTIVPFNGNLSKQPYFSAPETNSSSNQFLSIIEKLEKYLLSVVGLDKDSEKMTAQSGLAKQLEFIKTKTILATASNQIEEAEESILRHALAWLSNSSSQEIEVKYEHNFDTGNVNETLKVLIESFDSLPYEKVKAELAKEIIDKALPKIKEETRLKLFDAIDGTASEPPSTSNFNQFANDTLINEE
jgi:hypothetical protein